MFCAVSYYGKVVFTGSDADEQVEILNGLANGLQPDLLTAECVGDVVDAHDVVIVLPRNSSMQGEVSRRYFSSAMT